MSSFRTPGYVPRRSNPGDASTSSGSFVPFHVRIRASVRSTASVAVKTPPTYRLPLPVGHSWRVTPQLQPIGARYFSKCANSDTVGHRIAIRAGLSSQQPVRKLWKKCGNRKKFSPQCTQPQVASPSATTLPLRRKQRINGLARQVDARWHPTLLRRTHERCDGLRRDADHSARSY